MKRLIVLVCLGTSIAYGMDENKAESWRKLYRNSRNQLKENQQEVTAIANSPAAQALRTGSRPNLSAVLPNDSKKFDIRDYNYAYQKRERYCFIFTEGRRKERKRYPIRCGENETHWIKKDGAFVQVHITDKNYTVADFSGYQFTEAGIPEYFDNYANIAFYTFARTEEPIKQFVPAPYQQLVSQSQKLVKENLQEIPSSSSKTSLQRPLAIFTLILVAGLGTYTFWYKDTKPKQKQA